jgi:probable HAF family extracellular repeat protein
MTPFLGGFFAGYVAGLSDKGVVLLNNPGSEAGQWTPYVQGPVPWTNTSNSIPLGSLGGNSGIANALNNDSQIVGWSQIASGAQHAFLYMNGTMQDLNLLIPPTSGITLVDAAGIDASGRIVAYGTDASGQMDEFLLTPQDVPAPEPSTILVFGFAILAVAANRLRSRRSAKS